MTPTRVNKFLVGVSNMDPKETPTRRKTGGVFLWISQTELYLPFIPLKKPMI
jgi:hypothetical protein